MIIDWEKYTRLLLPIKLRTLLLIELIRTMIWQIPRAASDFNVWADGAKYRANLNASVVALQYLIQHEFGVLATIEELDGLPTDFLINVEGTVDEVRLKALIDQYKLAGRSYVFRLGTVVFSAAWTNYQCEDIVELYSAKWSDYVCEDDGIVTITAEIRKVDAENVELTFTANREVTSDINLTGQISGQAYGNSFLAAVFNATITSGSYTTSVTVQLDTFEADAYYYIEPGSVNVTPPSDLIYNYTFEY